MFGVLKAVVNGVGTGVYYTAKGVTCAVKETGKFVGHSVGYVVKASGNIIASVCGFSAQQIEKAATAVQDDVAEKVAEYLEKKGKKMGKKAMKAVIKKVLKKILIKFMTKSAIKKIPIAGIAAGTVFAVEKGLQGDWGGASLEFSSGCVSVIPIAGTAASMAIDIGILAMQVQKELGNEIW